jgi:uncharacterized protein
MIEILRQGGIAVMAMLVLGLSGNAAAAEATAKAIVGPDKMVYHINDTAEQATRAMLYINNHLEVNPQAKIVVVTHAAGIDFLMQGAKTANGNLYSIPIEVLSLQGVRFEICDITLRERQLLRKQFVPDATFVPSGVAEIARLQQREGYAYLRP